MLPCKFVAEDARRPQRCQTGLLQQLPLLKGDYPVREVFCTGVEPSGSQLGAVEI